MRLPLTCRSTSAALLCAVLLSSCAQHAPVAEPIASPALSCGPYPPEYAVSPDGFGCATTAILHHMVADPMDLIDPDPLADPYGDAAIAPVQRHRSGEVKPISGDYGASSGPEASGETPQK